MNRVYRVDDPQPLTVTPPVAEDCPFCGDDIRDGKCVRACIGSRLQVGSDKRVPRFDVLRYFP